jgi:transcriptional regulator with PAS, ATPase and Fis domain
MASVLISWIGNTDLRAPKQSEAVGRGPVCTAAQARAFGRIVLLSDFAEEKVVGYLEWLRTQVRAPVECHTVRLSGPTEYGEIYSEASRVVDKVLESRGRSSRLTFHTSPGTPAMLAIWIILAKTKYDAELIESSQQAGVRTVNVPFEISAEVIPSLLLRPDEELSRRSAGMPPETPEFSDIIHRSAVMRKVIERARLVAPRSVPILIEGESGTGKELLARAIHRASPRSAKNFVALNCGAIPQELIESELFGSEPGAFTGANRRRAGHFEEAHGGTIFLDEIGELPLAAQVKLLRVIQESEVMRLGSSRPKKIDVRIIAATNRSLHAEVIARRFREDLYYRIAVVVLYIPPLRMREGDTGLLIDRFLNDLNEEAGRELGIQAKRLLPAAKNLLLQYHWPGNVRELQNTLLRATVLSMADSLIADDIREALSSSVSNAGNDILNRPLGSGFRLQDVMEEVARHYLSRAMEEAGGNKTKAAELMGLPNYQTYSNWHKKYVENK